MSISSLQLDAFTMLSREKHFSKAANQLCISQSALSQRINNLESHLSATLFVRKPTGVELTELGSRLLQYSQLKESLEKDFLSHINTTEKNRFSGTIRLAGFSTIAKSILLPVLADIQKKHPALLLSLHSKELRELPEMLFSGSVDYLLFNQPIEKTRHRESSVRI